MNDELDMQQLTDALRAVGAPPEPPPGYEQIARDAALGTAAPAEVVRIDRHRLRRRLARPAIALVVIAASTIAALVIGVGGNQTPIAHTVTMSATSGAHASSTSGRPPAPSARSSSRSPTCRRQATGTTTSCGCRKTARTCRSRPSTPSSDGSITAKSTMPADMGWDRCWIALDSTAELSNENATVVLQS